jgi:N-acetylmuramoyl-L-alanine amidase
MVRGTRTMVLENTRMKIILRLALLLLLAASFVSGQSQPLQNKFKVVLDPGHGGRDSVTKANGYSEKNVVLTVALEIKKQLQEKGLEVLMTRDSDVYITLEDRAALKGDLFISLHANSVADSIGPSVRTMINGIEIYVDGRMRNSLHLQKSKSFASVLHKHLSQLQGIKPRSGVKQKPLAVLSNNQSPAVLVELGFLTNLEDLAFLTSEASCKKMATAFCEAIIAYRDLRKSDN